jgi:hypothetical protein
MTKNNKLLCTIDIIQLKHELLKIEIFFGIDGFFLQLLKPDKLPKFSVFLTVLLDFYQL